MRKQIDSYGRFSSSLIERIEWLENRVRFNSSPPKRYLSRLPARTASKTEFIRLDNIHSIEADGRYSRAYLNQSSRFLPYNLKTLEKLLDPSRFIRLHKSWLLSADHIVYIEHSRNGDSIAVLENKQRIRLSRRYKVNLKHLFELSGSIED